MNRFENALLQEPINEELENNLNIIVKVYTDIVQIEEWSYYIYKLFIRYPFLFILSFLDLVFY